jgi:HPt (histidine-containing phosphotransfer) domain-containing protein
LNVLRLLHPRDREELARRVVSALLHTKPPDEAEESGIQHGASAGEHLAPPDDSRSEPTPPLKPGASEESMAQPQSISTVSEVWQRFKEANANQVSALEGLIEALLENGVRVSGTEEAGREPDRAADSEGKADLFKVSPPVQPQKLDSVEQPGDGPSAPPLATEAGAAHDQNGPAAAATPPSHSEGPPDSATQQRAIESVAELWERFKESIMGRVAVLDQYTMALLEDTLDDELRENARREAHKLAGSVGLFGFYRGSELAQEIEQTLLQESDLDQDQVLRLSQMAVALRKELEQGPSSLITAAGAGPMPDDNAQDSDGVHMLVIDHDVELAEGLVMEGVARGMQAEMAKDLAGARDAISRRHPGVVLLNLSLTD